VCSCPFCSGSLVVDGRAILCVNDECDGRAFQLIKNWVKKLDIKEAAGHAPQSVRVVLIVFGHRGDGLKSRDDRPDNLQADSLHQLAVGGLGIEVFRVLAGLVAVEMGNFLVAVMELAGQRRTKRCSRTSASDSGRLES